MDEYYTKAELRNEMKKLKAKKDGYETEMNDLNKLIKSYLPEISSIREKIKKIEDDESLDKTESINKISRLKDLECAREYYKNNRELFDATQNNINELKEKFQDSSSAASYEFFSPEKINLFTGLLVHGFVRGNKAVITKLDFKTDPTINSIVQATKEICFQERLNLLTIHFCKKQLNYDLNRIKSCMIVNMVLGKVNQIALNTMLDQWREKIDKGSLVASIFLDLSKAFDTVDHN